MARFYCAFVCTFIRFRCRGAPAAAYGPSRNFLCGRSARKVEKYEGMRDNGDRARGRFEAPGQGGGVGDTFFFRLPGYFLDWKKNTS